MSRRFSSRNTTLILSGAAFLSFLGRAFLDFYAVMPEFGVTMPDLLPITIGYVAFFGGWLWVLLALASGSQRASIFVLVYNLALLIFGLSTFAALCPSPCGTAWPLGEGLMWSNVLIGIPATLASLRGVVKRTQLQPAT